MADLVTLDQVLSHLNMADNPPNDLAELELFVSAATDHVAYRYGTMPAATYTETLSVADDGLGIYRLWVRPIRFPVTAVTSATSEDGTVYSTGFTISTDGRRVRHIAMASGEWTLTYTAGSEAPADLKLAALEDIRGLYQPGQIGAPANFGAFDIPAEPTGFRPVNLWPRIDAWINSRLGSQIA